MFDAYLDDGVGNDDGVGGFHGLYTNFSLASFSNRAYQHCIKLGVDHPVRPGAAELLIGVEYSTMMWSTRCPYWHGRSMILDIKPLLFQVNHLAGTGYRIFPCLGVAEDRYLPPLLDLSCWVGI